MPQRNDKDQDERDPLTPIERQRLGKLAQLLGFAELMTLLMVAATTFSAIATWRTASIAESIYLASERPYFGVESIRLDNSIAGDPRVEVEYRNFGNLSADATVLDRRILIDGVAVASQSKQLFAGILSPQVPHTVQLHLPASSYDAIIQGRSKLRVEIKATYRGLDQRTLCYFEGFRFLADTGKFEVRGGTSRCSEQPKWEEPQSRSASNDLP
ncbi:MAG: hypothetical protein IVW54_13930 [Candidatus Binataceae bacterium]|nr:hypothetical protein [Candidatus Binataceae bacterium]